MLSLTNCGIFSSGSPSGAFGLKTSKKYDSPFCLASARKALNSRRAATSKSTQLLNVADYRARFAPAEIMESMLAEENDLDF